MSVAAIKRGAANAAFYPIVNGFRPGVGFDDLIKRVAIRAPERFCPDHDFWFTNLQHGDRGHAVHAVVQESAARRDNKRAVSLRAATQHCHQSKV